MCPDPPNERLRPPALLQTAMTPEVAAAVATTNAVRHDWIVQVGRPDRAVTRGHYQRLADLAVSTTDPDAALMPTGGGARLGSQTHAVVDGGQARIILQALVTPAEVTREVLGGSATAISIKTARTGFTTSRRVHHLAEGLGIELVMGNQIDGQLGSLCSVALALRSSTSILPSFVLATTMTRIPAMTALAGLVPCAEAAMSTTSRAASPRSRWYARITISPANSPFAPELG